LARERNDFRLARIEREKLERAQKHAERAQAGKTQAKVEDTSANKSEAESTVSSEATPSVNDKQAAIAAAIARAKAQKLSSAPANQELAAEKAKATNVAKTPEMGIAELSVNETQVKQDKQALIAAAIERAKAQKLAAAQAGVVPKNVDNISASVQAEINETDAIREKAKLSTDNKN
jgi:electron transport complex protein RnfC